MGGDIFSFYMQKENVDFSQALKTLAQNTGIHLRSQRTPLQDDPLYKINEAASLFFVRYLASPEGNSAREYISNRGLTKDTIHKFQLGLSPGDGHSLKHHLLSLGYTDGQLALSGLLSQTGHGVHQDLFRRRLMFPIRDSNGRLAGFGGRTLGDSNPKYLNSRQGPVFDKGKILYAFNISQKAIKDSGTAVVVEGYMDAIAAHQNGFSNVVASMGTSLTRFQIGLLEEFSNEVVLALDPDMAGQEATLRSIESSWEIMQRRVMARSKKATLFHRPSGPILKIASLPQGQDPDQIVLENPDNWKKLIENTLPIMEFLFKALSLKFDVSTAYGKAKIAETLFPLVAAIPDTFEQDSYFGALAKLLNVSESNLEASIGRPFANRTRLVKSAPATTTPFERMEKDPIEEYCLALLIQNPGLGPLAVGLRSDQFQRVENREVFTNCIQASTMDFSDQPINDHFNYLATKSMPPSDNKEKEAVLADCICRLEERRLRQLKVEEGLRIAQMDFEEINEHKEAILKINNDMEALFRSRSM